MTNSNLMIKQTKEKCNSSFAKTLNGFIKLLKRSIAGMEKRHIKLKSISKNHFDAIIRLEAEKHLKKQTKMIFFGYELLSKINDKINATESEEGSQKEIIERFLVEIDIMHHMDFSVTKRFFSFINIHFEPQVIYLNQMAA